MPWVMPETLVRNVRPTAQVQSQKTETTSKALAPSSDALVTSSFLLLVVRPGAPSSDALNPN